MPSMGEKSKYFPTEAKAMNFISFMRCKNPHCQIRLHTNMDRTLFYVHWICSEGWYEGLSGGRKYY